MKIEVFNFNILSDFEVSRSNLIRGLKEIFFDVDISVNLVFVEKEEIKRLNRDFRGVDEVTDVLAFGPYDDIGEIYVYPYFNEGSITKENIRVVIHGILHLLGYDHEEYFDSENPQEEMFILQEKYLKDFYDIVGNG